MTQQNNELSIAIQAARKGAVEAMKYFTHNPEITVKPDNSPVTIADKECEQAIKKVLLNSFPKSSFLAEESGTTGNNDFVWVIDPIDATKNFIRNLPFWGIQIALAIKGEIVIGVSYAPALNELFFAEKGEGAYLNNQKIAVSKINKLENATLLHGTIDFFEDKTNNFLNLSKSCYYERGFGDFYGYTLVACGKADIMLDAKNGGPWDIAAIKIIVEEAGGMVTNINGEPWNLSHRNAVATNGLIHSDVIHILNENK